MSPGRFDHVALGVWKLADAPEMLVGRLGGVPHEGGPGPGYEGGQWIFENQARIEVIQPAGEPGGFLHRFLERQGPGIHHVTFKVPSLDAACQRARDSGYDIVGYNAAVPAWKEAFLHPKQAQGIVVQLAETDPSASEGDGWGRDWDFPDTGREPPARVRVVGLRLTATGSERARRQWERTLGGVCSEVGAELIFRWQDSPMRIAVTLDADATEGPLAIEVASERSLELPARADPALGARFVQVPTESWRGNGERSSPACTRDDGESSR